MTGPAKDTKRCYLGGELVSSYGVMPDQPSISRSEGCNVTRWSLGCSNLGCAECGVAVRNVSGRLLIDEKIDPKVLYERMDWSADDLTTEYERGRIYGCRCTIHPEYGERFIVSPPGARETGSRLPWSCQGHPVAVLPLELEAVTIEEHTDLEALAHRLLTGWQPESAYVKHGGAAWLAWIYEQLEGHPYASRWAEVIASFAGDDDPVVRGGVFYFFWRYPFEAGYQGVLNVAAACRPPATFPFYCMHDGRVGDEFVGTMRVQDLLERYIDARDEEPEADARALEGLGHILLMKDAEVDKDTYRMVGHANPQWVRNNVHGLLEAHPGTWHEILSCLLPAGDATLVAVGKQIIESGAIDEVELRDWFSRSFPRFDWADTLRGILDPGTN